MNKVTVILTVWKRYKYLEEILLRYLANPEVDEILIWDNSQGDLELELMPVIFDNRIKVFTSPINYGAYPRHILSNFAKNDITLIADDDLLVEPEFVGELMKYYTNNRLIGIWGRVFDSKDYHSSPSFRADRIDELKVVDFVVGLAFLTHRKHYIGIDYRDMKWTCYDLHLNGELQTINPALERCIVPNKFWKQTDEEVDQWALNLHPDALKEKQELFERYFADAIS